MKTIKIIVEKTSAGYSAYAEKYPVYSTGEDVSEIEKNIRQALAFFFRELGEKDRLAEKDIKLIFSIPSFFELYPINIKQFAVRIGMNYTLLSQYVRGRKKPSPKQTQRIVEGLQQVGKELSKVSLT